MLEEIGMFRKDWWRSQTNPEEVDFEIEDEKPSA
jgi:hypothetical protein